MLAASDSALVWQVEQLCLNACPALAEISSNGWLLRFTEGSRIRRTNSVNPARAGLTLTPEFISFCEAEYRKRGLPVLFRVPDIAGGEIDAMLARRGYHAEGLSLTLFADIATDHDSGGPAVDLSGTPTTEWLDAMGSLQLYSEKERVVYARAVALLTLPAIFAAVRQEGRIVSAAYGVLSGPLVCFESVVTGSEWRGRGLARAMLSSILGRASARGAQSACLQVQADNAPAIALYRSLGFRTELYRYHYRRLLV